MAITATAKKTGPQGAYEYILVLLAFSDTYSTGGDTVDLTDILNAAGLAPVSQPGLLPLLVDAKVENTDGYYVEWVTGTTLANGKLRIWQPGGSEYSAGAYGAPFSTVAKVFLRIELQDADR
jgi:hypothetical protein